LHQSINRGIVAKVTTEFAQMTAYMDEDTLGKDAEQTEARAHMVALASNLFRLVWAKYGGTTTLNELLVLNYGVMRDQAGADIAVTGAAKALNLPKSTVSRALTNMRARGLVIEEVNPADKRRRVFRLAPEFRQRTHGDIDRLLHWCAAHGWGRKDPGSRGR
jgi:DNA-binding MarR family transcriptional regulator